ncbi:uncharacterized protein LOC121898208 [Thunnus maccoyii]|uniref:uncharacterized protein LOC121898208 n=1 Tax=Thunnus maccoyii TaxID=8240 RepID=UPI001C4BE6D7|nr:uncharacterized protein LOC121898208 [Thunnus maccoyii]
MTQQSWLQLEKERRRPGGRKGMRGMKDWGQRRRAGCHHHQVCSWGPRQSRLVQTGTKVKETSSEQEQTGCAGQRPSLHCCTVRRVFFCLPASIRHKMKEREREKRNRERKRVLRRLRDCRVILYKTGVLQDEGKDEPCCILAAHLLLSGPHLLLLCHTAHFLAQDSTGCTRREQETGEDGKENSITSRENQSENTNERKSGEV